MMRMVKDIIKWYDAALVGVAIGDVYHLLTTPIRHESLLIAFETMIGFAVMSLLVWAAVCVAQGLAVDAYREEETRRYTARYMETVARDERGRFTDHS